MLIPIYISLGFFAFMCLYLFIILKFIKVSRRTTVSFFVIQVVFLIGLGCYFTVLYLRGDLTIIDGLIIAAMGVFVNILLNGVLNFFLNKIHLHPKWLRIHNLNQKYPHTSFFRLFSLSNKELGSLVTIVFQYRENNELVWNRKTSKRLWFGPK